MATVAAIGTPLGNVRLTAEAEAAIPASPCLNVDPSSIVHASNMADPVFLTKWAVTGMGESARLELSDTGVRVTLIEPGMVDTPFFDNGVSHALQPVDVARTVMFAVSQPPHVDVNEILIRPTAPSG
jgi:NAD(P)-dependent dehydrogenase (short-subunit alcohol dehydrogenase family)